MSRPPRRSGKRVATTLPAPPEGPEHAALPLDLFGYPYIWTIMERLARSGLLGLALQIPLQGKEDIPCCQSSKKS